VVAIRKVSGVDALMTFFAAIAIAVAGTALGLGAASLGGRGAAKDHGIQLVHPLQVPPEVDRANHDQANH
jgi:hypothetical protein